MKITTHMPHHFHSLIYFQHSLPFRMTSSINAGEIVNEILEGEMFCMTLSKPKNDNAQHLRVVSAVPLRTGFRPAIKALREYYGP